MAILENIRKRTTILILIIGLALFAFVISGVFSANNFSGGGVMGSSIAEVNGKDISREEFSRKVERTSRMYGAGMSTTQMVNTVWNQELRKAIMDGEFEELGIDIEQDQIINYLKTNPSYAQNPQFMNENGVFDEAKFLGFIADLRDNVPEQYQLWLQDEAAIQQQAKEQIYFNLIKAGNNASLTEGEFDYKLSNEKVDIQYVRVPYTSIPDSTIEVTKKEIETYMRAHENDFQQENARDLQFVFFEQKPSAEDEKAIEEEVRKLMGNTIEFNETDKINDTIAGFATTADVVEFLDRKSDIKFDTIYRSYNDLPSKFADSLMALQVAELYGPYRDGNYFKVARMMKRKPSGSVKASHILIAYEGAERANPAVTRTKEEAETLAKELLVDAKKADAEFTQLARDNSDGPSAPQGGDLGYFEEGVMTPKFNDFAFGNPVGHIGLVETEFGFHIVKVDDKRDIVQIAYLAREVEPSEETINTLFTDATKFEMAVSAKDADFSAIADESEYIARPVNKVKAMDENLPGLGAQRTIVNWAFAKETELGDIRRFDLPTGHAVVQVTGRYKEGLMSVEDGSATALPILRKDKKAEQIMSDNAGKSFEDFASTNNVSQSNATALSIKSPTLPGAGREPMVVGAAHAMAEGATSKLIKGETGVFMVKVTQKTPAKELDNYSTFAGSLGASNGARANTEVYNALKEAAEIEDNRSTFY